MRQINKIPVLFTEMGRVRCQTLRAYYTHSVFNNIAILLIESLHSPVANRIFLKHHL